MRRREFLSAVGAAAVWPFAVRAQQRRRIIGFLSSVSPGPAARPVVAFQQGLQEEGFVGGQNLAIEYRWAEGYTDRLPDLVADLLQQQVEVIVATGGGTSALAAKTATSPIPIVFSSATDPVTLGLVLSLNRPGGNITGVYVMTNSLEAKRLGLLNKFRTRRPSEFLSIQTHRALKASGWNSNRRRPLLSGTSPYYRRATNGTLKQQWPTLRDCAQMLYWLRRIRFSSRIASCS
jgi:ABC-type nitrate/sulfonate/bicarbonate transport system substrate-binding protein